MNFTPRLTEPDYEKIAYYRHTGYYGGLNKCAIIDTDTGAVMPNCTGYAWGRFYELTGNEPALSTGNAEDWYEHNDGYYRGNTPKLGAVICYANGGSLQLGHVAIVEEIDWYSRTITCSNSGYTAGYFYLTHLSMDDNYAYYDYEFQGFIYNPVNFTKGLPLIYYARNVRR